MKLTDKLKKHIDEYFDNISSEEVYKLATEKYKFKPMKTAEDFLKEGNEGLPLRLVIDNLTDEEILQTMRDYAQYHIDNYSKYELTHNGWDWVIAEYSKENIK